MGSQKELPSVLYIVPSAGIGGAETFIKQVAKYSNATRPVFALLRSGPLSDHLLAENQICEIAIPEPRTSRPWTLIQTGRWLKKIAQKFNCKLVHSSMAYSVPFGSYVSRSLEIPHIWYQHGPVGGWRDQLAGQIKSNLWLTNSQHTLESQKQITSKNISGEILSLGVDFEEFCAPANKKKNKIVKIAMLCRPQRWKGLHVFAQALNQIKIPYEAFFIGANKAGSETDYEREVLKYIDDHKVNLHFVEKTTNPQLALKDMDLLVNASTTPEPFGLSIIEAMALKVVPILPNVGGPSEIAHELPLHYDFADPTDLAKKIEEIASSIHFDQLQNKTYDICRKHYDAKNSIANLERIYERFVH